MTYACSFLHDCSEFSYAKNIDLSSCPSVPTPLSVLKEGSEFNKKIRIEDVQIFSDADNKLIPLMMKVIRTFLTEIYLLIV